MSTRRTVRILRRAQHDLQQIYDYLAIEAPRTAGPFVDKLLDAIESLSTMAERGAVPRDKSLKGRGYRFLVHRSYLVFYKTSHRQVTIHRVLRGSRDYRGVL